MTKIKICGITNYEDAVNASRLGADFLGFNFYRKSPRYIEKSKAKEIIQKLPKGVKKVGVFVNEDIRKIKELASFCKLDIIQLSGDENPDFILNLRKALNKKIIKSFGIGKNFFPEKIFFHTVDYILLDSYKKGFYGGTGTTFDLDIAKQIDKKKLFLSGGLSPSNVKLAVERVNPYAVDVCSSIELYPGKKDCNKMKDFIEVVKQSNKKILISGMRVSE